MASTQRNDSSRQVESMMGRKQGRVKKKEGETMATGRLAAKMDKFENRPALPANIISYGVASKNVNLLMQ